MMYSALGLAVIGAAVGLVFRWQVLLPVIVLLPIAAIVFSVSRSLSYGDTAIVVIVAEAVLQGGYFAGLLVRFVLGTIMESVGAKSPFGSRPDPETGDEDRDAAGAGKGP